MKTFMLIIAIFYLVCFLWFVYEVKHAPILSDEDELKLEGFTQEEIDKLLNKRGQRGN